MNELEGVEYGGEQSTLKYPNLHFHSSHRITRQSACVLRCGRVACSITAGVRARAFQLRPANPAVFGVFPSMSRAVGSVALLDSVPPSLVREMISRGVWLGRHAP